MSPVCRLLRSRTRAGVVVDANNGRTRPMVNDEETVATLLPEPADGVRLVVQTDEHDYKVIWRDDLAARQWHGINVGDQVWWTDANEDPMALYQHIQYAIAVWSVGTEPVAVFNGKAF